MTRAAAEPMATADGPSVLVVADQVEAAQHIGFDCLDTGPGRVRFLSLEGDRASRPDWPPGSGPDVLVLSRVRSPKGPALIERARAEGIPVVYHLDEDLLAVPAGTGSGKAEDHGQPARLAHLRRMMEAADLVYAATEALAERLAAHRLGVAIAAGPLSGSVDPGAMPPVRPATWPVVGCMASGGRGGDVAMVFPVVEALLDARPGLAFELFGSVELPARLRRFGHRVAQHPPVRGHGPFLRRLAELGWWVGLAPLEDSAANRARAETAWIEYAQAGVAVVASDLPAYRSACSGGCGLLAGTPEDWRRGIAALLDSRALRSGAVEAARGKLAAGYAHDRLRAQHLDIFARLIGEGAGRTPWTSRQ